MKRLFACCVLSLVFAPAPAWAADETVRDVVTDMQTHGYPSTAGVLDRLQHASDVPGADAPLEQRLAYDTAVWPLQKMLRRPAELKQTMAALQQLADTEHCLACRFELELQRAGTAMDGISQPQAQEHLDAARASLPAGDRQREERLLALEGHYNGLTGHFNVGIEQLLQASALADADGDITGKIDHQAALAWINADLGDLARAQALGQAALADATALNYQPMMAWLEVNLGHVYAAQRDGPRERAALERALALSENAADLFEVKLISLNDLSDYYLGQSDRQQRAFDLAQRAYRLTRGTQLYRNEAVALANMGIAAAHLGRVAEGIALLRQSVDLSERNKANVDVIGISAELVNILQAAGRYQEALLTLQKADALQETVTQQQRQTAVLDLQEKYAANARTQEIKRLSAENAQRAAEVAAKAWQQRLWAALAAMLTLGSVLLAQTIRRARTLNRKLAVANETLTEQSMIDPLTRAFNRRHCQELIARLQRPAPRRRQDDAAPASSLGLLLLDVDFFKHVNDVHGHAAGDVVLVAIAQRLRALVRENDAVARWGGEEFLLVLTQTSAEGLPNMALRVLHAIGDSPVVFNGTAIPITVSIGTVFLSTLADRDWEAALGLADLALYQAKAGGRNRASCVMQTAEHGDAERKDHDPTRAQAIGDIELQVVTGPGPSPGTDDHACHDPAAPARHTPALQQHGDAALLARA